MQRAVCVLSIVPVRAEPSDRSEQVTQLLYGEVFTILDRNDTGKWVHIEIEKDHYQGWIDAKQYFSIEPSCFEQIVRQTKQFCLSPTGIIQDSFGQKRITQGAVLPAQTTSYQYQFFGSAGAYQKHDVIRVAQQYLATPYLWGGTSVFGIDCSGFVQQVFALCGQVMPRDAWQQAEQGSEVVLSNAQSGDLAFFKNDQGKIVHVGIILPDAKIIHAHAMVRIDKLDEKGIFDQAAKQYTHQFAFVRRIIDQSNQ